MSNTTPVEKIRVCEKQEKEKQDLQHQLINSEEDYYLVKGTTNG